VKASFSAVRPGDRTAINDGSDVPGRLSAADTRLSSVPQTGTHSYVTNLSVFQSLQQFGVPATVRTGDRVI
jgi:hypothetical protein